MTPAPGSVCFGLITLLAMMLTLGCSSTDQADSRIEANTKSLYNAIAFEKPIVTHNDNGLMEVSQSLRNTTRDVLYIEYRFEWLDDRGRPVEPRMIWRYMRLEPNLPDFITATATSEDISDYRMELRWSRP